MNEDYVIIELVTICGPHCVGIDEGTIIFNKVLPILKSKGKVCLDFKEVLTITSSFLNASIGKLFGQFENGTFEDRITWKNVDENDEQLIKLVIKNAKEHFAKNKKEKRLEEDILRDIPKEEENA
jgi:hypothetical protein